MSGFLPHLASRLAARTPYTYSTPQRASVCIILRVCDQTLRKAAYPLRAAEFLRSPVAASSTVNNTEVFFIKRSINEGDPWSGNVAFPGGRQEAGETDQQTAVRECLEEVGINLEDPASFMCLGRLDDRPVYARGKRRAGFAVCPFVFVQTCADTPPLKLDDEEVAAARWVPVSHLTHSNIDPMGISLPFRMLPALASVPKPLLSVIGLDTAHYPAISLPYRPLVAMHEASPDAMPLAPADVDADESTAAAGGSGMRRRFAAASSALGADVLAEMATSSHKAVDTAGAALPSHHRHHSKTSASASAGAGVSGDAQQLHSMGMEGSGHATAAAWSAAGVAASTASPPGGASASAGATSPSGRGSGAVERFDSPSMQFLLWGLTLQATSDLLAVAGHRRLNWPPIRFRGGLWNGLVCAVCGALEVAEAGNGKRSWRDLVPRHMAALVVALMLLMALPVSLLALLWRPLAQATGGATSSSGIDSGAASTAAGAGVGSPSQQLQ